MSKNPNENCLAGMRCPECKAYGPFSTVAKCNVSVSDDGTDSEDGGNTEFEDDAWASCDECGHEGVWADFHEENQSRKRKAAKPAADKPDVEKIVSLIETGNLSDVSAHTIYNALSARFGLRGAVFGRVDFNDELGRDIPDDAWARIQETYAWRNNFNEQLLSTGWKAVRAVLKEAALI